MKKPKKKKERIRHLWSNW